MEHNTLSRNRQRVNEEQDTMLEKEERNSSINYFDRKIILTKVNQENYYAP